MTATEKREAIFEQKANYTNYGKGIIQGHYAGKKTASYLKTHTRCTKGHGWTMKGEFGGCALCENE